ncbi:MAG TPA: hypothetical protein VGK93_09790 [Candidatus Eisenbacteria bacterium]|jgi:glucose/arabinose dehydrogenase
MSGSGLKRHRLVQAAGVVALAARVVAPFLGGFAAPAAAQTTLPSGFADQLVKDGLDLPVGMAFLPDGRLLLVEQKSAKVRLLVPPGLYCARLWVDRAVLERREPLMR